MNTYKVNVKWQSYKTVTVQATCLVDAAREAVKQIQTTPKVVPDGDTHTITANASISDVVEIPERIVEFVYYSDSTFASDLGWRKVKVIYEDATYIKGNDLNKNGEYRCFLKDRILSGKIIEVK